MEQIPGYAITVIITVIAYFLSRLVKQHDELASKHEKARIEVTSLLRDQAQDQVRMTTLAESIVNLQKSDESLRSQMTEAITRLVRLEERSSYREANRAS